LVTLATLLLEFAQELLIALAQLPCPCADPLLLRRLLQP
jgi:hypothetical protein